MGVNFSLLYDLGMLHAFSAFSGIQNFFNTNMLHLFVPGSFKSSNTYCVDGTKKYCVDGSDYLMYLYEGRCYFPIYCMLIGWRF